MTEERCPIKNNKNEESLRDLCDYKKRCNICIIRVPGERGEAKNNTQRNID